MLAFRRQIQSVFFSNVPKILHAIFTLSSSLNEHVFYRKFVSRALVPYTIPFFFVDL